jgi:hypothetical protein
VDIEDPDPQDLVLSVECAGEWDRMHHREDYSRAFVDTRYDNILEHPYKSLVGVTLNDVLSVENDGKQINFILPQGSIIRAGHGVVLYWWPLDGKRALAVNALGGQWTCAGNAALVCKIFMFTDEPFNATADYVAQTVYSQPGSSGSFSVSVADRTYKGCLIACSAYSTFTTAAPTTVENSIQLRFFTRHIDNWPAPRVDQAVGAVFSDVYPGVAQRTEAIGGALNQLMIDPFETPAEAVQEMLAKAAVPPRCGVFHRVPTCVNRPTAPSDLSRLWVVSKDLTPGLKWRVGYDGAASKDFVALTYNRTITTAMQYPSGQPFVEYFPDGAINAKYVAEQDWSARVARIDTGADLPGSEAAAAVVQAYAYYHELVQGQASVPYELHDGAGNLRSIEHIESGDWIVNVGKVDAKKAGPFLIDEVTIQAGIADIAIGATEGYSFESPYRLPFKGRYYRARRVRERYRKWSKSKTKPKGRGWHKRGKRWWRWAYRFVNQEGYYA